MYRTASRLVALLVVAGAAAGPAQVGTAGTELVVLAQPCLNLRSGPDTTAETLRCLPPGRRVTLVESREGWGRVRLPDDQEGWVALRLLGPAAEDPSPRVSTSPGGDPAPEQIEALETELARLRRDNEAAFAAAEMQRQEALETLSALRSEVAAQKTEAAELLRDASRRLEASAAEEAQREEAARQRVAEAEAARSSTEAARNEALEEAAARQGEAEALRSEAAELRATSQRLEAAVAAQEQSDEVFRRRIADLEQALASAVADRAGLEAELAELVARPPTPPDDDDDDAQRQIEDLTGRLRAAEMFLTESDRQRREYGRQLAALKAEAGAPPERAGAEPGEAEAEPVETAEAGQPGHSGSADVMAMVNAWAEAWSKQRVEEYLSFYASSFVPPDGQSRERWEALRRERLEAPGRVNVGAALLDLRLAAPDRAEVEFIQSYTSDRYSDAVVKTLELVVESGSWKIARETTE